MPEQEGKITWLQDFSNNVYSGMFCLHTDTEFISQCLPFQHAHSENLISLFSFNETFCDLINKLIIFNKLDKETFKT